VEVVHSDIHLYVTGQVFSAGATNRARKLITHHNICGVPCLVLTLVVDAAKYPIRPGDRLLVSQGGYDLNSILVFDSAMARDVGGGYVALVTEIATVDHQHKNLNI
jgi:hypothetical protein